MIKNTLTLIISVIILAGCAGKKGNNTDKEGDESLTQEEKSTTDKGSYKPDGVVNDISSSKSIPALLCQNWEYKTDAEGVSTGMGDVIELDIPYRSFCFFKDYTVVVNPRNHISFGTWSYDDETKSLVIKYANNSTEKYLLNAIGPKSMILTKKGDEEKIKLIADAKTEDNLKDDPFYKENNLWRIKPSKPETEEQIKERLRQCVRFYKLFFDDNIKKEKQTISFQGLPGCFKWYTGGISIQKEENLDSKWISCFYNRQQAMQAHEIMENVIVKQYTWKRGERNWLKQTAPVLEQIIGNIK